MSKPSPVVGDDKDRMDLSGVEKSPMANMATAFDFALKQREFEINQLTQRNNFFMVFQGVLIGGVIQVTGASSPLVTFLVCLCGLAVSLLQTGMAGGAKFWQSRWEMSAKRIEMWLLEALKDEKYIYQFFTADKNKNATSDDEAAFAGINAGAARAFDPAIHKRRYNKELVEKDVGKGLFTWMFILPKYSVSRIPIYVGLAFSLFWLVLWLQTFKLAGFENVVWYEKYIQFTPMPVPPAVSS